MSIKHFFFVEKYENYFADTTLYLELCRITRKTHFEGWAQDYGNSNIFLKPLFRGKFDPFVNNANLGAIAHTSNGT